MQRLDLRIILLGMAVLILAIISFNLYMSSSETKEENEELKEEVERLRSVQSMEQAIYTRTEDFLRATLEGGSIDFFSNAFRKETEQQLKESEDLHDGSRSQMENFEIFNISVRQENEAYQVYAIYKVNLTGIDGEFENPGQQPLLYLTSRIKWIEEEGEWRVDAHELETLASGEEVEEAISNG
ncbi:hypothetical protein ACSFXN_18420 [Planococcus sp. 1R117A]|uniref:hypothetical protein n=1 Tax=Planococcus sp. 1R117A TaxID=3447020 RepID=UPI003EDC2049